MIHAYRGYYIQPHKVHPRMFVVVTEGRGGKIPNSLSSMFTSLGVAQERIDYYLNTRPKPKDKNNASKESTTSGD